MSPTVPPSIRPSLGRAIAITLAVAVAMIVPLTNPATASAAPSVTATASADRATVPAGGRVELTLDVRTSSEVTTLVDVEIYGPDWNKVHQRWWTFQTLQPGTANTFETTWNVPATLPPGTYTAMIGVFTPTWDGMYHWNPDAVSVTVTQGTGQPPATTTAPTTASTTPSTPPSTTASTTVPSSAGVFTDGFANLDNWSIARWANASQQAIPGYRTPAAPVCGIAGALPPNDVAVCGGRLQIAVGNVDSTNYSDTWLRADRPYDFHDGGTFSVDLTTSGARNEGFPELLFTSTPYSATSLDDLNSNGPTPADGMLIQLWDLCSSNGSWVPKPAVYSFVRHAQSLITDTGQHCAPNVPTDMSRVEVTVEGQQVSITANDSLWWRGTVPGITETGYAYLGVHNHSTSKYSSLLSWSNTFDNVSYPALAATAVAEVPDSIRPAGSGVATHYTLPTGSLVLPAVPAGAAHGLAVPQPCRRSPRRPRCRRGLVHRVLVERASSTPRQRRGATTGRRIAAFSIPVDVNELRTGDNSISVSGGGWGTAQAAFVGNIDLIVTTSSSGGGGGGSSPTTTVPAPTTTRPPTATTTTAPATTTTAAATTTTRPPSTTAPPMPAPPSGDLQFSEDFASEAALDRFDWQLHASSAGGTPCNNGGPGCSPIWATSTAEHDMACNGPTTFRSLPAGTPNDLTVLDPDKTPNIYYCAPGNDAAKGHVMTVINTEGVVILSFSPKQTFRDVRKVCFDINTNENIGAGKWVNTWIVPVSSVSANGGRFDFADAPELDPHQQHPGPNDFHFKYFDGSLIGPNGFFWWAWDRRATESASRFTQCVEQTAPGRLTYTRDFPGGKTETQTGSGDLPDGEVRVIFQDGSYNPDKHGGTGGITWHWDNLEVS